MDVAVTKDNVLVISHDPHINREICQGPHVGIAIRELTLAELHEYDCGTLKNPHFPKQQPVPGTRIPTLDEVLNLCSGKWSSVQHRDQELSRSSRADAAAGYFRQLMLEVIRKHNLESRCIIQSFDFRTLRAMKTLAPHIRLAALWEGAPRPFVDIAKEAYAGIISPYFPLATPQQVEAAHAAKLEVVPWTADTSRRLAEADRCGSGCDYHRRSGSADRILERARLSRSSRASRGLTRLLLRQRSDHRHHKPAALIRLHRHNTRPTNSASCTSRVNQVHNGHIPYGMIDNMDSAEYSENDSDRDPRDAVKQRLHARET